MTATAIREKLYDYIKVADEKRLTAIYNLLEDQIVEQTDWHEQEAFVAELDDRVAKWENAPDSAIRVEEVQARISALKLKRSGQ